eukprot:m.18406 g.18406  ORF g.18406 m.18406 type:complete len:503 (+) comp11995_c0_seq1:45-1553(+)
MTAPVDSYIEEEWKKTVVPTLEEYITIPNQSPLFDPEWQTNGLLDQATKLFVDWAKAQNVPGLSIQVCQIKDRTPLIFMVCEPTEEGSGTVLLYGHLDKQPPFEGWNEGLDPYKPVTIDGKLYGRGGADDGYAIFSAITAIQLLKKNGTPHARYVIVIEACEESGSPDLPFYIEDLKDQIGTPDLIVCLDSGAGNYDQLWVTTSLRGIAVGTLSVDIIAEGVHSGDSSGVIPDTFRIARGLLDRVEDVKTGDIKVPALNVEIPAERIAQTKVAAAILKEKIYTDFPFVKGATPVKTNGLWELALNRTWRPTLTVTGASGLPSLAQAGNVLRPNTTLNLSFRCPPSADPEEAQTALKKILEADAPYGAKVVYNGFKSGPGWDAPALADWLETAAKKGSMKYFGKEPVYYGEGGSIPFMGMLGKMFPQAQFFIIGVLGPASNAHGPNEFLHIPYAKKLTCVVSSVLADHAKLRLTPSEEPASKKRKTAAEHAADFGRDEHGCKI